MPSTPFQDPSGMYISYSILFLFLNFSVYNSLVWKSVRRSQQQPRWLCLACNDGRLRERKHCNEHEQSDKHRIAMGYYNSSQSLVLESTDSTVKSSSSASNVTSTLDMELDDDSYDVLDQHHSSMLPYDTTSMNPDEVHDSMSYTIEPTSNELIIAQMSQTISQYSISGPSLGAGTYSDDSDDEWSGNSSGKQSVF